MTLPRSVECAIRLKGGKKRRHRLKSGITNADAPLPLGRLPRIAKLLALAHKFEGLLRQGAVADYAALARLGQVSRARITQIMNLLCFAPDIQEDILFLPLTTDGRDPMPLHRLQAMAQMLDWRAQRALWQQLRAVGYLVKNGAHDAVPRSGG